MADTLHIVFSGYCPRGLKYALVNRPAHIVTAPTLSVELISAARSVRIVGGEPFVNFSQLRCLLDVIRDENCEADIVVHTAQYNAKKIVTLVTRGVGVRVYLHTQEDAQTFTDVYTSLKPYIQGFTHLVSVDVAVGVTFPPEGSALDAQDFDAVHRDVDITSRMELGSADTLAVFRAGSRLADHVVAAGNKLLDGATAPVEHLSEDE